MKNHKNHLKYSKMEAEKSKPKSKIVINLLIISTLARSAMVVKLKSSHRPSLKSRTTKYDYELANFKHVEVVELKYFLNHCSNEKFNIIICIKIY